MAAAQPSGAEYGDTADLACSFNARINGAAHENGICAVLFGSKALFDDAIDTVLGNLLIGDAFGLVGDAIGAGRNAVELFNDLGVLFKHFLIG